jgi:biopolymer transport protein ExbD
MREMFVVSLDDLGQLYVEKQPVNEAQMMNALQNYHQYNPNGLIVLHASRNTSYNDVVQLLDSLRSVGGDKVALATLPGENNASGLPSNDANPPSLGLPGSPSSPFGSTLPDAFSTPSFNTPLPGVPNLNNGGGSGLSPNFASPRFSPGSTIPQAPGTSQAPPSANAP